MKNLILMVKYVHGCDKFFMPIKVISILFSAVVAYIETMYLKWLLDFIINYSISYEKEPLFQYFALIIIIQLVALLFYSASLFLSRIIIPRREYVIKNKLQNLFINRAMHQNLARYEDWEFYDTYTKTVRYADTKALDVVNLLCSVLESIISILVIASIIAQLDRVVLLIILFMVIISTIDQSFSNRYSQDQYEAEETINRESEYIKKVAHHRQYAKEVRTFQLAPFLIDKLNDVFVRKNEVFQKANGRYWRLKYLIHLIYSLVSTPALLFYIGFRVLRGFLSVGSFTVLFSSAFSVSNNLASLIMSVDRLRFESKYYVSKLCKMLDIDDSIECNDGADLDEINSIEFNHVYFRYPGHERWVLENISFKIEKGEHVALVGKNGAGKSTILKLILRLYDVTEGTIRINGVDISKYNTVSLRNGFSAVLQDFQIMDFSIRDNLCLGKDIPVQQIEEALDFVQIKERVHACKNGVMTYIGRDFDRDGENFSGGECQKLAIARGILRKGGCCIWDEANSSLDPFAEADINQKILKQNQGKMMIIVTHRLTAAVNASKIIHIEDGKIVAIGGHSALLQQDPLYEKMFHSQAEAYRTQRDNRQYE